MNFTGNVSGMNQLLDLPLGITEKQELLLKAALLPADEAIGYWQKWKKMHNPTAFSQVQHDILPQIFDPLDYDSQRLLPLLYRNLEKSGDPIIDTLRGFYRYTWMKGNSFLNKATGIVDALQKAGFDVMLLKGLPTAILYYKNMGTRPMDDIDIFVPLHQIEKVKDFLEQNYNLKANAGENKLRKLGMFHAMHFTDNKGLDFDLHWHFHIYNLNAAADQTMWDNKIPLLLTPEVTTYTLSPTHQLYRNFTHGYTWLLPSPPIRWIPDSLAILREASNQIDWDGLFELAQKQRLILPVCSMLRYLKLHFNVDFPDTVLRQINILHGSNAEKYYFKLLVKANAHKGMEWKYFFNKTSRILLRYHLYQERDINNSFPIWLFKRIRYTLIFKGLQA